MRVSNCLLLLLSVLCAGSIGQAEAQWSQTAILQSYIRVYQSTGSELVLFLRGLSKGLTGEDIGADLGECLGEGEQLISDV